MDIVFWKATAFPCWRAMDRRWNKNTVSLVSSVMAVMHRPVSWTSSMAKPFHESAVSTATGQKMCVLSSFIIIILNSLFYSNYFKKQCRQVEFCWSLYHLYPMIDNQRFINSTCLIQMHISAHKIVYPSFSQSRITSISSILFLVSAWTATSFYTYINKMLRHSCLLESIP